MSYIISLLLGGMLGRVAGPIAQDFFENETNMGKRKPLNESINYDFQK